MSATAIKEAIKANLDELVTAETLSGCSTSDLKKDPLAGDIPAFPWAFLMPPSIESEALDNRTNLRTYNYDIMILWNAEDVEDATTVEEGMEAVMQEFDNDPTLSGTAMGGVLPVSSAPQPFQHSGRDLIMAVVQIQAKQHVSLSF
ncbi:hypothetical protein [Parerythrobacter lacustris]|uniref:DUF3168 domain-containing protein n=1 Tax=Parerythrobacter lacustris TaxID=2969984 RepID=A0ABT1XP93_9SPHN|nr:hypothetical protein [Parerythrobacter lacustris]MCR2833479.1 hypothetical protein [Parerythrobacter lacustris]